ncbi:MAG: hypothetical protein ACI9UN_001118 [Granulosicoccus sp.]|jgi:hypothetical protein
MVDDLGTFGREPAEPTGLQAEVYSATTAELFWDRPLVLGLVYEVTRDGKLVNETDNVSYFDESLSPGLTFRYEVVAINLDAKRASAATVSVSTDF